MFNISNCPIAIKRHRLKNNWASDDCTSPIEKLKFDIEIYLEILITEDMVRFLPICRILWHLFCSSDEHDHKRLTLWPCNVF